MAVRAHCRSPWISRERAVRARHAEHSTLTLKLRQNIAASPASYKPFARDQLDRNACSYSGVDWPRRSRSRRARVSASSGRPAGCTLGAGPSRAGPAGGRAGTSARRASAPPARRCRARRRPTRRGRRARCSRCSAASRSSSASACAREADRERAELGVRADAVEDDHAARAVQRDEARSASVELPRVVERRPRGAGCSRRRGRASGQARRACRAAALVEQQRAPRR